MSSDKFTIEINGIEFEARPGQMLIEVTDAADIHVPRFLLSQQTVGRRELPDVSG